MRALLAIAFVFLVMLAFAHGGPGAQLATDGTWDFAPAVVLPLEIAGLLFLIGTVRVWRRAGPGRGIKRSQVVCFWLGWIALAGALVSPLHWLGEQLFAAHMIEHEILMAIAAPLLVVARPGGAYLWALPASWRPALGGVAQVGIVAALWRRLTDPLVATILHGFAIWAWHVPAAFQAALESEAVHWLQHLSFFVTALLFWWALLYGRARERGYGAAVFYLFATALHSSLLGVLLALAHRSYYPVQTAFAAEWGLTPLEDQQLAGFVMWVPAGLVYAVAALALAGLWIRHAGASARGGDDVLPAR